MNVGITGSDGFVGWHLRCALSTLEVYTTVCANRDTFADEASLDKFVSNSDVIVHLAGVNRASDKEILEGNINLADQLISSCIRTNSNPRIIFASSTHVENPNSAYGQSKNEASLRLRNWAEDNGADFLELVIPHVFGEYGRPEYNSVVATFCHKIARGQPISINSDGKLELVHVQDLCDLIIGTLEKSGVDSQIRIEGKSIGVSEVADKIKTFSDLYKNNVIPDLVDNFDLNLFNTFRGAIPYEERKVPLKLHQDDRGWLFESIKVKSGGQHFISSTVPSVTRGQHFHRRKFERFCVVKGEALIQIRRVFYNQIYEYRVSGDDCCYVDMPTLHTHNITNVGNSELITMFWSNEIFDPENPDTYGLAV